MILHAGIIALLLGALLVGLVSLAASLLGLRILLRWNPQSSSQGQLQLERQTWLVGSLMNLVLGFQIFSLALFVYTLEDIHSLFVGAMCATGSLNANQIGWLALLIKLLLMFGAALWVWLNRLDLATPTTPLVKIKYRFLLLLTPLLWLDFYLQASYFSGLEPQIITSCCGSLFGLGASGVASELAALPAAPTMVWFYAHAGLLLLLLGLCLWSMRAFLRLLLLIASAGFILVGLVAVVAFISPYIYAMPNHHCPFDMLQGHYGYIGYPLYLSLFGGGLFAMLPGLGLGLRRYPGLQPLLEKRERLWLWLGVIGVGAFVVIASWPMVFGRFILLGY
ncbi:MAG: hypothetical protein GW875_06245 [Deltaproteobacteria bacterium]|nr:hypothetical protein [Deltaproteobacteria bacterium]NCP02918.1 hypothetical protein [Deltaproteobacteria bacterium]